MNKDEMVRFLEEYRDGVINEENARAVAAVIRDGGDDARWILDELHFTGLLAQALDSMDDESFARSFIERLAAERGSKAFSEQVISRSTGEHPAVGSQGHVPSGSLLTQASDSVEGRSRDKKKTTMLSYVLGLVVVVVVFLFLPQSHPSDVGQLSSVGEGVELVRKQVEQAVAKGTRLQHGDLLRVPVIGEARVLLNDESWLHLSTGASVTFAPELPGDAKFGDADPANTFSVLQVSGVVEALLTPRSKDALLVTPHGVAESKEGRFSLTVTPSSTLLAVESGTVIMTRRGDGQSLPVKAGETLIVSPGEPMLVQ